MQKASYGGGGKFKLTTAFFSCTPSYHFLLLFSFPSYVFLYGHDASGGRDDDDDDEDDQEGESGEDSSSDNDSLLSDLDGREGMSDDDDGDGGDGAGATPTGKKKPAAGVDSSKRKTMFAEMKRESMAGSLQPSAKKGGVRRQRRDSTGDSDEEDLEQMQVPIEEEEEEEEDSGDDDQEGARGARSKSKSRSAKNKNNAGSSRRRGRAKANTSDDGHGSSDDEEDVSDLSSSVASDDNDQDEDEDEGGGNSSGDEEEEEEEDGEAQPRFLIYFWAGTRAKKSDWVLWKLELAKSMLPEWQKVINAEIPQVQVAQGQEPLHFRRLFGQGRDHGRLIVHDRVWRKRDNPEKRVSLFKVQRVPEGEFQTFQARDRYTTRWRREGERGREFSQVGGREVQCVIGACCGRFAAVCRWLVRDGCRAWLDLTR